MTGMGFERIENSKPSAKIGAVPTDGLRWTVMFIKARYGNLTFIRLTLGETLVQRLAMAKTLEKVPVALLFGTGADAGKLALHVDATGDFAAHKRKGGERRTITLDATTSEGLFNLEPGTSCDFAAVAVQSRPNAAPMAIINLPEKLLAGD